MLLNNARPPKWWIGKIHPSGQRQSRPSKARPDAHDQSERLEDGRWKLEDGVGSEETSRAHLASPIFRLLSPISYPGFVPSKTAKSFGKQAILPAKKYFQLFSRLPCGCPTLPATIERKNEN